MIWVLGAVLAWGLATRNLILAVPADLLIWAGWLLVNPFTSCGWCKGKGRHPFRTRRTYGKCWNPRCQRGTVQRFGSKTAHRAVRALRDYIHNSREG
ncbi:MAG TPA: hypothetical protein VMF87_08030 [Streptosporangiaceae bacterium]|nr:hypothetical protein [Streptosporangiaceae bacterium]